MAGYYFNNNNTHRYLEMTHIAGLQNPFFLDFGLDSLSTTVQFLVEFSFESLQDLPLKMDG